MVFMVFDGISPSIGILPAAALAGVPAAHLGARKTYGF